MKSSMLALILLMLPNYGWADSVLQTPKVVHVIGEINEYSKIVFLAELAEADTIDGDLLVTIDSPGGSVSDGQDMIDAIDAEKARGVKVTCVVQEMAASMAFNLLTHCDTRIADSHALLLFHKIEIGGRPPGIRMTAKNLRKIADLLDIMDERYRQENAAALKMTPEEYDFYADHETRWEPSILKRLGYLDAIGNFP